MCCEQPQSQHLADPSMEVSSHPPEIRQAKSGADTVLDPSSLARSHFLSCVRSSLLKPKTWTQVEPAPCLFCSCEFLGLRCLIAAFCIPLSALLDYKFFEVWAPLTGLNLSMEFILRSRDAFPCLSHTESDVPRATHSWSRRDEVETSEGAVHRVFCHSWCCHSSSPAQGNPATRIKGHRCRENLDSWVYCHLFFKKILHILECFTKK